MTAHPALGKSHVALQVAQEHQRAGESIWYLPLTGDALVPSLHELRDHAVAGTLFIIDDAHLRSRQVRRLFDGWTSPREGDRPPGNLLVLSWPLPERSGHGSRPPGEIVLRAPESEFLAELAAYLVRCECTDDWRAAAVDWATSLGGDLVFFRAAVVRGWECRVDARWIDWTKKRWMSPREGGVAVRGELTRWILEWPADGSLSAGAPLSPLRGQEDSSD